MRRCNSPNLQGIQCLVHSNWIICSLLRIGIGAMGDAKDATPRPMLDTRCIDVRTYLFPADGAWSEDNSWVGGSILGRASKRIYAVAPCPPAQISMAEGGEGG